MTTFTIVNYQRQAGDETCDWGVDCIAFGQQAAEKAQNHLVSCVEAHQEKTKPRTAKQQTSILKVGEQFGRSHYMHNILEAPLKGKTV